MTRETTGERLARLEERVGAISTSVDTLTRQGEAAGESRRRVYEEQEAIRSELAATRSDIARLHEAIAAIRPTTEEYKQVRDRVIFAGRLGRFLWSIGKALLSAAAGAAAAWYAMTGGKPPSGPFN